MALLVRVQVSLITPQMPHLCNGNTSAFQADNKGSIPLCGSTILGCSSVGESIRLISERSAVRFRSSQPFYRNIAQWQSSRLISDRFKVQVLVFRPRCFCCQSVWRAVCKIALRRFESCQKLQNGLVSQLEDYPATNRTVQGSSPCEVTNIVLWCNGSTGDFDTLDMGSTPVRTAKMVM